MRCSELKTAAAVGTLVLFLAPSQLQLPVGWYPWPLDAGVRGGRYFIYRPPRVPGAVRSITHGCDLKQARHGHTEETNRTAPRDDHPPQLTSPEAAAANRAPDGRDHELQRIKITRRRFWFPLLRGVPAIGMLGSRRPGVRHFGCR